MHDHILVVQSALHNSVVTIIYDVYSMIYTVQ
jgi:hypothetical protein